MQGSAVFALKYDLIFLSQNGLAIPTRRQKKSSCKLSPALCIVSLVSMQNVVQSRGIFPSWSVATEDPEWTGMEMGETCTAIAPAVNMENTKACHSQATWESPIDFRSGSYDSI